MANAVNTPFRKGPFGDFRSPLAFPTLTDRTTQVSVEVFTEGQPTDRTTSVVTEVFTEGQPEVRATNVALEVWTKQYPDPKRGIVPPPIFRPKDVIKVRGQKAYPEAAITQPLVAGLLTNTNTFFSPTVTPGSVGLSPGLLTNTQTFFSPTVILGDLIYPGLLTNTETFFTPTVYGNFDILDNLFVNANSFYPPTIATGKFLDPGLLTNTNTLYPPTIGTGIRPGRLINTNTFFPPVLTVGPAGLFPQLFINNQTTFFPVTISTEEEIDDRSDRPFKKREYLMIQQLPIYLTIR